MKIRKTPRDGYLVIIQHSKTKFSDKETVSYETSTKAQNAHSVGATCIIRTKSIYYYYCNWPL